MKPSLKTFLLLPFSFKKGTNAIQFSLIKKGSAHLCMMSFKKLLYLRLYAKSKSYTMEGQSPLVNKTCYNLLENTIDNNRENQDKKMSNSVSPSQLMTIDLESQSPQLQPRH